MKTMIDYQKLIEAKVARLKELQAQGGTSNVYGWNHVVVHDEAWHQKKIDYVMDQGATRAREMIEKIQSMGYELQSAHITPKGVAAIKTTRGGIKLFGFVDPSGKLVLNIPPQQNGGQYFAGQFTNVMTINYQRKNMVVHDRFLEVILKRI